MMTWHGTTTTVEQNLCYDYPVHLFNELNSLKINMKVYAIKPPVFYLEKKTVSKLLDIFLREILKQLKTK